MQNRLNLSSRPFVNHRLFWVGISAVLVVTALTGLWLTSEKADILRRTAEANRSAQAQIKRAEEIEKQRHERELEEAKIVITEDQEMHLAAARQLIQAKVFSWDKLLSDFQSYIPKNARVVNIVIKGVQPGSEGDLVELQVTGLEKTSGELTDLMSRFDKSGGLFTVSDVGQGAVNEIGEFPFTMRLQYSPAGGAAQ
ncbi:MAG TPA: hypothetical protein VJX67_26330 [Blastocatellia bacterium]|nr:hypothetical protein [Blastocatellia bacterium]